MPKTTLVLKRSFLIGAVFVLTGSLVPAATFADDPSSQTCTPPANSQAGVHHPVGADASMYTYDCATGLWESPYYSYDPSTGLTTATYPIVYTYNPGTGNYDTTTWAFNAPQKKYVSQTVSVSQPPAGAMVVGAPAPVNSSPSSSTGSDSTGNGSTGGNSAGGINNTGPDSNNSVNGTTNNNLSADNQNNLTLNNGLTQQASSGNTVVMGNTTAGSATSGDAINTTNVVNNLQSTSDALGGNTVTFVANIDGDVNGDLLFDPAGLSNVQNAGPNSVNTTNANVNNNVNVNNSTNAQLTNNINQAANSGDATVSGNTSGGNATSGNTENIANVVDMVDSMLTAGQSFIGTININGNLNGNILLPANFVNQLIADNVPTVNITGPNSSNTTNANVNNNVNVNNTNSAGVNNNLNSSATSGNATVSDNTNGGSATSGNASNNTTSVTAFNLTGSNVIGANDLLVFVNVTGQWVGLILNAPAGTTAAEFGGGITTTGPDSSNTTNANVNNNASANNTTNEQITNNINQQANSGNATVSDNTTGGNATSGNAANDVNLANVENSSFNLSGWFGILFINVFGSWHGNFGVEPSPGDFATTTTAATTSGGTGGHTNKKTKVPASVQVFGFVSHLGNSSAPVTGSGSSNSGQSSNNGNVLGAQVSKHTGAPTPQLQGSKANFTLPIIAVVLFGTYLAGDRYYTVRRKQVKQEREAAAHAANIQAQAL